MEANHRKKATTIINDGVFIMPKQRKNSIINFPSVDEKDSIGAIPLDPPSPQYVNTEASTNSKLEKLRNVLEHPVIGMIAHISIALSIYYIYWCLLRKHTAGQIIYSHSLSSMLILIGIQILSNESAKINIEDKMIIWEGVFSCISLLFILYALQIYNTSLILCLSILFGNIFSLNGIAYSSDLYNAILLPNNIVLCIGVIASFSILATLIYWGIPYYSLAFLLMFASSMISESTRIYLNRKLISTSNMRQLYYSAIKLAVSPIIMFFEHQSVFTSYSYTMIDIFLYMLLGILSRISTLVLDRYTKAVRYSYMWCIQLPISAIIDWWIMDDGVHGLISICCAILCVTNIVSALLVKEDDSI